MLLQCTQPHAGLECHAHTQRLCVAGWLFGCGPPATGTRRCFAWPAFICLLPGARVCCMRCISFLQHSTHSTYMCWCRCVMSCTQALLLRSLPHWQQFLFHTCCTHAPFGTHAASTIPAQMLVVCRLSNCSLSSRAGTYPQLQGILTAFQRPCGAHPPHGLLYHACMSVGVRLIETAANMTVSC